MGTDIHDLLDTWTTSERTVDATEATPVLRAYLATKARLFVRKWFDVNARSTDAEIAAEAPRHPVFEVIPAAPQP